MTIKPSPPKIIKMQMVRFNAKLFLYSASPVEKIEKPALLKAEMEWKTPAFRLSSPPRCWWKTSVKIKAPIASKTKTKTAMRFIKPTKLS